MTDAKTDIKSEEKKSKYWKFTAVEDEMTKHWQHSLGKKGRGFLGKIIDDETTPEYDEACKKAGRRLNRTKKYRKPAYYHGVIALDEPMTKAEITDYLANAGAKDPEYISDQEVDDQSMKDAIAELTKGKYYTTLDSHNNTQVFPGNWTWSDEAKKQYDLVPGKKPELNFYRYFRPRMYSKTEIVKYCYWTNKCLQYLPHQADGTYSNDTYKFDYDVWSTDTILRVERLFPVVMKCAKRKYDRQHDPDKQKKAKVAAAKRAKTRYETEQRKRKAIIAAVSKEFDQMKLKLPAETAELEQMCYKMTILNHAAKYLGDWYNDQTSKLDEEVNNVYSMDNIYELKNKFLDILYLLNPKELKLSMYDPPQDDYWYDEWGEEHRSNRPAHYYACYNFELIFKDGNDYDYHMPYPLAKNKYPSISALPKINQIPNGVGPYMFGEEADKDELRYIASMNLLKEISQWIRKQMNTLGINDLETAVKDKTAREDVVQRENFRKKALKRQNKVKKRKQTMLRAQKHYLKDPSILTFLITKSINRIFSDRRIFYTQNTDIQHRITVSSPTIWSYLHKHYPDATKTEAKGLIRVTYTKAYQKMIRKVYKACLPYQSNHGLTNNLTKTINSFDFDATTLIQESREKVEELFNNR